MIVLRNMIKEKHNKKMTFFTTQYQINRCRKAIYTPLCCVVKIKLTPQQFVNGNQIHFSKTVCCIPKQTARNHVR